VFVPDRLKQQRLDERFDATYQELTTLLENHKKLRELIILSNEYKDFTQGSIPEDAKANFRQEDSEANNSEETQVIARAIQQRNRKINIREYERDIHQIENLRNSLRQYLQERNFENLETTLSEHTRQKLSEAINATEVIFKDTEDFIDKNEKSLKEISSKNAMFKCFRDFAEQFRAAFNAFTIARNDTSMKPQQVLPILKNLDTCRTALSESFQELNNYIVARSALIDSINCADQLRVDIEEYLSHKSPEDISWIENLERYQNIDSHYDKSFNASVHAQAHIENPERTAQQLSDALNSLDDLHDTLSESFKELKDEIEVKREEKIKENIEFSIKGAKQDLLNVSPYLTEEYADIYSQFSEQINQIRDVQAMLKKAYDKAKGEFSKNIVSIDVGHDLQNARNDLSEKVKEHTELLEKVHNIHNCFNKVDKYMKKISPMDIYEEFARIHIPRAAQKFIDIQNGLHNIAERYINPDRISSENFKQTDDQFRWLNENLALLKQVEKALIIKAVELARPKMTQAVASAKQMIEQTNQIRDTHPIEVNQLPKYFPMHFNKVRDSIQEVEKYLDPASGIVNLKDLSDEDLSKLNDAVDLPKYTNRLKDALEIKERLKELLDKYAIKYTGLELNMDWINIDNNSLQDLLAIGGSFQTKDIKSLANMGIQHVVDTREEACDNFKALDERGIKFCRLPAKDETPLTIEQLDEGTQWVKERLDKGERVLIHCEYGIGQSVLLACAVLVRLGITAEEALKKIQSRRPQAKPNDEQWLQLKEFEADSLAKIVLDNFDYTSNPQYPRSCNL
jgi:hypothetical protein